MIREEEKFNRQIQQLHIAEYISEDSKVSEDTTSLDSPIAVMSQSYENKARKNLLKDDEKQQKQDEI